MLIFPLVIVAQRNAAKMSINLPQLQTLQLKMTEARQSGNQLEGNLCLSIISVSRLRVNCVTVEPQRSWIITINGTVTRARLRVGPARQLPRALRCRWNNRKYSASKLRFPHAKEFLWKLSAEARDVYITSVLMGTKLLARLGRPRLGPALLSQPWTVFLM